jgi:hypothetical protein
MENAMRRLLSTTLAALVLAAPALALDDLVINSTLDFETCDEFIVPVLIHTMPGGDELGAFARLIQRDQRIWLTKSHYLMFRPEAMGIFVALLQGYRGAFLSLPIFDSDGLVTCETKGGVNPLTYRTDIMSRVVPVLVPVRDIPDAFPRSDVYRISAQAFPKQEGSGLCGGEASTSIIVNLAYN